jgi:hypothetical protein
MCMDLDFADVEICYVTAETSSQLESFHCPDAELCSVFASALLT